MLTADLDTRADLTPGTVLTVLNNQTAEHQVDLLTTLYYNSTRLPDLEPTGPQTRLHLESLLRTGLASLDPHQLLPHAQATARAKATTQSLLSRLHTDITRAESLYTHHHKALTGLPIPTAHTPPATSAVRDRDRRSVAAGAAQTVTAHR